MDPAYRERLSGVLGDLRRIFGARFETLVAYGRHPHPPTPSLALVSSLTIDDLAAMAAAMPSWHRAGAATPVVLPRDEFRRSLDAFPIEYGEIIDTHLVLHGDDPFADVAVDVQDVRRAVEVQASSHLLHLRENFLEHGGRPAAVAALVSDSAPGFAALLRRMASLDGHQADSTAALSEWAVRRADLNPRVVGDVLALAADTGAPVDGARLFPEYLLAMEALTRAIDQWRRS